MPASERVSSCSSASAGLCAPRSEEHTSELQSRFELVCRLLLVKKKIDGLAVIADGFVDLLGNRELPSAFSYLTLLRIAPRRGMLPNQLPSFRPWIPKAATVRDD